MTQYGRFVFNDGAIYRYIEEHKISDYQFAAKAGIAIPTLFRAMAGRAVTAKVAVAITNALSDKSDSTTSLGEKEKAMSSNGTANGRATPEQLILNGFKVYCRDGDSGYIPTWRGPKGQPSMKTMLEMVYPEVSLTEVSQAMANAGLVVIWPWRKGAVKYYPAGHKTFVEHQKEVVARREAREREKAEHHAERAAAAQAKAEARKKKDVEKLAIAHDVLRTLMGE